MRAVLFVAFGLQVWTAVIGYPTGAPAGRCVDMTPGHNVPPQTGTSPYSIIISSNTFSTNNPIKVMIRGPVYAGLLLQARSGNSTNAVGTWGTPPPNTQYLACAGTDKSAITHSNANSKNIDTTYTWIPPASINSSVIRATVVSNRTIFWVGLSSPTLTRDGNAAADHKMVITPVLLLALLMLTLFQ